MADVMLHPHVFRNIPDEVLEEILSYHVTIHESLFFSPYQHFGKYDLEDQSSSVILEVCKRWMRIGTPLLYETVVLRSKPQVLALRTALDGNPALCRYIKKLRVEDTYGMAIADVMQMCSGVLDVWVSLRLQAGASETGKGLSRGLRYLNPRTIVFWDYSMGKIRPYSSRTPLFESLASAFTGWKRLTSIRYLSEPGWMDFHARDLISGLDAFCPQLEYLYFTDFYFSNSPMLLSSLSKLKKLKKIWILEGIDDSSIVNRDLSEVTSEQHKDVLKKVAIYQPDGFQPALLPPKDATPPIQSLDYAPLRAAEPRTRTCILAHILAHHVGLVDLLWPDEMGIWKGSTVLAFAQVSHDFRYIALPFLYSDIELKTQDQCRALDHILEKNPHFGNHIRHVKGDISTLLSFSEFHSVLRKATKLASLQGTSQGTITCEDLSAISILVGKTLRFLKVAVADHPELTGNSLVDWSSLSVSLWGLQHLTALSWSSEILFEPSTMDYSTFKDALPQLRTLSYASPAPDLMTFLCKIDLPKLFVLEISKACNVNTCHEFLRAHGRKLRILDIASTSSIPHLLSELCPNVLFFAFDITDKPPANPNIFNEVEENDALVDLSIYTSVEKKERELRFLENVDFRGFSALSEIYLESYEWPTEQRAISKSLMVRLAEKWWLEQQLRTVDRNGVAWKPRLKAPRSTKRVTGRRQLPTLV